MQCKSTQEDWIGHFGHNDQCFAEIGGLPVRGCFLPKFAWLLIMIYLLARFDWQPILIDLIYIDSY